MRDTLKFLTDLSRNNNKEWFDANKGRCLEAKSEVEALTGDVLAGIRSFDDTIGPLSPKDCTYRIYRDQRFSKDKTPYKTHMGVYINQGGKKSGYSGYYFHIGAKSYGNMVAVGDIWCPPEVLKVIREDIMLGGGDFRKILSEVDPRLVLDMDGALKRVPAGFPKDTPDSDFYRVKAFCLYYAPDDKFFTDKDLASRLVDVFHSAKPFLDYINRAIDYCREEKKEYFSSLDF